MGNRFASSVNYLNGCRNGDINVVKKYIKSVKPSEISKIKDIKDALGWNGLLLAAKNGNTDIFMYLMENYCDINDEDDDGNNSFLFACQFGHTKIMEILVEKKVSIFKTNKSGFNAFLLAAQEGQVDIIKLLFAKGYNDIAFCNNEGQNGLLLAIAGPNGNVPLIQLLLDMGIDIKSTDKNGNNALHYAAQKGNKSIVDFLLALSVLEVNSVNDVGKTALHLACVDGNVAVIQRLIDSECDITILNNSLKKPLDYIQNEDKKREIEEYISRHRRHMAPARNSADIKKATESHVELMQKFFVDHCGLSSLKASVLAKELVCTEHIDTIKKLESLQKRNKLLHILQTHQTPCELSPLDIECIGDYLNELLNDPVRKLSNNDAAAVGGGRIVTTAPTTVPWNCFMTHNWGVGNENHLKVKRMNEALQQRGILTWFDGERMDGDTRQQMIEGIENSTVVVVFVTDAYRTKVNQADDRDNCRFEFKYAFEQKGTQFMIPVVMEPEMRNPKEWRGYLGATLGTKLFIDFSDAFNDETIFEAKINELHSRISSLLPP